MMFELMLSPLCNYKNSYAVYVKMCFKAIYSVQVHCLNCYNENLLLLFDGEL